MTSKVLILLNAVGCLLLAGVVVVQWLHEGRLEDRVEELAGDVSSAHGQLEDERAKVAALEQDIALLKDSLAAAKEALAGRDEALLQRAGEIELLNGRVAEGNRQLEQWAAAVKERDEAIGKMQADLQLARQRLDEAVEKLKAVSKEAAR